LDAAEEEKEDGFVVEQNKVLEDTLVIFEKNQFLLYDYKE